LTRFEFSYLTSSTSVAEVMIKEPVTIDKDGAVEEAARIMNEQRISSLLVMDGQELIGIITDTNIFEALMELMGGRRSGVRLTVHIADRAGALAAVTGAIAEAGGYLSAVGGWYVKASRESIWLASQDREPQPRASGGGDQRAAGCDDCRCAGRRGDAHLAW
jgi:hypothetical protein